MTYYPTHPYRAAASRYRRRRARPRPAMGGLFDFVDDLTAAAIGQKPGFFQGTRNTACAADADAGVATMSASVDDFERTWNPTGFYTTDQMQKVILAVLEYSDGARGQITTALSNVDIHDSDHKADAPVFDKAYDQFNEQSQRASIFVTAMNAAKNKGIRAVDAPGLKLWVIALMRASVDLTRAALFINCNKSSFERVSAFLNDLVDRAIAIIKTVVGVVLAVGEQALSVVGDLAGFMVKLVKFGPYLLLLGGGLYLYKQYRDR